MTERFDEALCRGFYGLLGHSGETEVRIIPLKAIKDGVQAKFTESLFVSSLQDFVYQCGTHNGETTSCCAGLHERRKGGTKSEDVIAVRTVYFDLDAARENKQTAPATPGQIIAAEGMAWELEEWMSSRGFKRPIVIRSGNGCHIFCPIPTIAVSDANRHLVELGLRALTEEVRTYVSGREARKPKKEKEGKYKREPGKWDHLLEPRGENDY